MPTLSSHTDEELLQGWKDREDTAFRELIRAYFPVVCHYSVNLLSQPAQAEDVAQEAFIALWKHPGTFDSLPSLRKFLFISAKNACLNANRSRERELARNHHLLEDVKDADMERKMAEAETLALIYREVAQLPDRMKEIFYLSYEEGLSLQEIADKLDIQLQTVKNQKYKAFEILRKKFGNNRQALQLLISIFTPL